MRKLFLLLFMLSLAFLTSPLIVFAQTPPSFSSCLTPNGTILADYPTGDHGIVGDGSKNGHDTVYVQPQGAMQCFCGSDGAGVQTNWLRTTSLTDDQIKVYQSEGWVFVPSGSAWGLESGSYLAKNSDYSCSKTSITTNTHSDGLTDGRTDGLTDGRSDGNSSIVQATTGTSSFNLASTGNLLFILEVIGAGSFMSIIGLVLRHYSN